MQKAQSWSLDIALGVIIFVAAFFVFYTMLKPNDEVKASNLKDDASIIIKEVGSEGSLLRIVDKNEVNLSKVSVLKNITYDELKRAFRIEGEFCIYLEDEEGNIVLINNSYKGVGSPNINISGTPCSQK